MLFDAGAKPDVLRHNMAALKVDPARIQAVVIPDDHGDHAIDGFAEPDQMIMSGFLSQPLDQQPMRPTSSV